MSKCVPTIEFGIRATDHSDFLKGAPVEMYNIIAPRTGSAPLLIMVKTNINSVKMADAVRTGGKQTVELLERCYVLGE